MVSDPVIFEFTTQMPAETTNKAPLQARGKTEQDQELLVAAEHWGNSGDAHKDKHCIYSHSQRGEMNYMYLLTMIVRYGIIKARDEKNSKEPNRAKRIVVVE